MRTRAFLIFLTSVCLTFATTWQAQAQILGIGGQKTNTELIPQNAFAAAVFYPKQIGEDPKLDLFPREIVTAWGQKEFGFDPMLITQVTIVAKKMEGLDRPPEWGAVLHFDKLQGLGGQMIDKLAEKKVGDRTLFSGTSQGLPSFLVFDDSTMLVGDESFFEDMVAADGTGGVVGLVKRRRVKGQAFAVIDIAPIRDVLNQATQLIPGMMPPAVTKLRSIPEMVKAIELGVDAETLKTDLIIHAVDDETAKEAGKIIANALDFGAEMGVGTMAAQMDFTDPVQKAVVEYAQRVSEEFTSELTPQINGNALSINLDQQLTVAPVLVGMLLPAVQQVRAAARRTTSMNNMRQQTLAVLNYESAHGKLPAQANYDKNGKPLLSWRVHILPFIEQQALYDQFHLDEPWDSPHNKKLISKMPATYQSPTVAADNGKTVYLGVAGEGMMFGKEARTFADITDGTSNTVLAVEVNSEMAVTWTQPKDFTPDKNNPLQGLGRVNPGGFIVTFVDGSTHFIGNNVDIESWKNLMTIGDGNVISGY